MLFLNQRLIHLQGSASLFLLGLLDLCHQNQNNLAEANKLSQKLQQMGFAKI